MRRIKEEHSFKVSRIEGRPNESCFKTLDDLQNLLIKQSGKARARKCGYFEIPFRLNPGDKPNDAQL